MNTNVEARDARRAFTFQPAGSRRRVSEHGFARCRHRLAMTPSHCEPQVQTWNRFDCHCAVERLQHSNAGIARAVIAIMASASRWLSLAVTIHFGGEVCSVCQVRFYVGACRRELHAQLIVLHAWQQHGVDQVQDLLVHVDLALRVRLVE